MHDRQDLIFNRNVLSNPIAVIGCGGVGFWVATLLAMSGAEHLGLYDSDIVEESNRARLLLPESAIGLKKTTALKNLIITNYPATIVTEHLALTKDSLDYGMLEQYSVIFECTDNPAIQYQVCQKNRHVISAHYDGLQIDVETDPSPPIIIDDERGYTVTPSWVVPAIITSALAVFQLKQAISIRGLLPNLYCNFQDSTLRTAICAGCKRQDCDNCNLCGDCRVGADSVAHICNFIQRSTFNSKEEILAGIKNVFGATTPTTYTTTT